MHCTVDGDVNFAARPRFSAAGVAIAVAFKCQNWLTANLRRRRNDPLSPLLLPPHTPIHHKQDKINKTKDTKRKEQSEVGVPTALCMCLCEGKLEVKEESSSWRRHVKCGLRQKAKEEKKMNIMNHRVISFEVGS